MKCRNYVRYLMSILCYGILFSSFAQNPIVQTNFTADPASLVYGDRFYIFAGRDQASEKGTWFSMREWRIYSSGDMVNWTDHGPRLRPLDFAWSNADAWASQCIVRDGKFYWYVSTNHKDIKGKAIGVAVSNDVLGPYTDARGTALVTNEMTPGQGDFDDIDPSVFVDDDGQAYMYWGNGKCKYVRLNADMVSFSDSVHYADVPRFGEAPWLHKHDGVYYLSYSSSLPSTIEYCTGDSPIGPWTYRGRLLEPVENCATSHQAISQFKGNWYFVYHNGALPTGGNHRRSVCVEEFTYQPDGSIAKLSATQRGVKRALATLDPYTRVEAETIALSEGVQTLDDSKLGVVLTDIQDGDYVQVRNLDFGKKGATAFQASVMPVSDRASIEIRIGDKDGEIVGRCVVSAKSGTANWNVSTAKIKRLRGIQDLCFVFKGVGEQRLFQFDHWQFVH